MPSLPPTLVSLCLHSHAFCLSQLVVVLPLVIHPLSLQLLGMSPPPCKQCFHLSWLRRLLLCPSSSLVQLPLVRIDCFSRHHLLLLVHLPSAGATTSRCAMDMVSSFVGQYSTLEYQKLFWVVSNLYLYHTYHVRQKTLVKQKYLLSPPKMRALL
jgi:hypothetical protein